MATKRLTMRNIREILRLHFEAPLSLRKISICTKASIGGVQKLLVEVKQCGLTVTVHQEPIDSVPPVLSRRDIHIG